MALYREAREVLAESLAVFRERGDAGSEAQALRLLGAIHDAVERRYTLTGNTPKQAQCPT